MLNGENMDDFTVLYISFVLDALIIFDTFLYSFQLSSTNLCSMTAVSRTGTIDYAQNA